MCQRNQDDMEAAVEEAQEGKRFSQKSLKNKRVKFLTNKRK